jgi:hypothetical protein
MISNESVLSEREVIRALQIAIDQLKSSQNINNITKGNNQKNDFYKEIDFFQKAKFNKLTEDAVIELKEKIKALGILKTENLSEYVISSRINYPRAYEEWSIKEKELLSNTIKFTNDLDLLSECFQRGKGSIESYGKKLIYESHIRSE